MRFDRIRQARPQLLAVELDAIDDDLQRRLVLQLRRIEVVQRHRLAVHEQPVEAFPSQLIESCDDRGKG